MKTLKIIAILLQALLLLFGHYNIANSIWHFDQKLDDLTEKWLLSTSDEVLLVSIFGYMFSIMILQIIIEKLWRMNENKKTLV